MSRGQHPAVAEVRGARPAVDFTDVVPAGDARGGPAGIPIGDLRIAGSSGLVSRTDLNRRGGAGQADRHQHQCRGRPKPGAGVQSEVCGV